MTDTAVHEELGEVLSPSQVNTYLTCPAKWYFRYLLGLTEPATGSLALGRAFHATLAANFRRKMSTGGGLQQEELRETFEQEWILGCDEAEFRDDEDADDLAATGEALVSAYMTEAANYIKPRAVEQPVTGAVGGVKVQGVVDVIDTHGCIYDFKTASKRPNGVAPDHAFQLTTYAMIAPGASRECRLHTVTKTKTVQVIQQTFQAGDEERRFAETVYPMVQASIRDGIYPPHRSGPLCSRRHCWILANVRTRVWGTGPEVMACPVGLSD